MRREARSHAGWLAWTCALLAAALAWVPSQAVEAPARKIPRNATIFIAPQRGYETFLKVALQRKQVPLQVVEDAETAEYEMRSTSDSQEAGLGKKIILGDWHSREEASIVVIERKTGQVVFAYSVHKESSMHGRRSTAEACAKHLKEAIE